MTHPLDTDPALRELDAMRTIHTTLADLDPDARRRALNWLCSAFDFTPTPITF